MIKKTTEIAEQQMKTNEQNTKTKEKHQKKPMKINEQKQ
jgi:hypothetical protein